MVADFPPCSEPMKRSPFLPRAIGFMDRFAVLLSISRKPSFRYGLEPFAPFLLAIGRRQWCIPEFMVNITHIFVEFLINIIKVTPGFSWKTPRIVRLNDHHIFKIDW